METADGTTYEFCNCKGKSVRSDIEGSSFTATGLVQYDNFSVKEKLMLFPDY